MVALLLTLACGQGGGQGQLMEPSGSVPAVFFPVMKPADAIPAGIMPGGTLAHRDGCLWLDRSNQGRTESFLVLWPAGSTLRESDGKISVHDQNGVRVATVGERIEGGGGETRDLGFVRELTGQTPPPQCQLGESYWRAYGVRLAR